jgi:hypothetical protein
LRESQREFAQKSEEFEQRVAAAAQATAQRDTKLQALEAALASAEERNAELTHAADQKLANAVAAARAEREATLARLTDEYQADSATATREFKALVKERDEAVAALEAHRAAVAAQSTSLAAERKALVAKEEELSARFDREISKLKRERDSVTEQRDILRKRFERVFEQQRELLDEIASDSESPQPDAPAAPPRPQRRERKETNVIELSEAELVSEATEPGRELHIQLPQPVRIQPPQVRIL